MYKYSPPNPIIIDLCTKEGFLLREKAVEIVKNSPNKGAEKGTFEQQTYGALAELVVRKELGLPLEVDVNQSLAFDVPLNNSIKMDVKCRGGKRPFLQEYLHLDGLPREAKHNFFARQVFDSKLDTDIYLMCHLETTNDGILPGTTRQKKWRLYMCGWVSKGRVLREGVYIPRGGITEKGNSWFPYRGQEIEYYDKNLNGLKGLMDLFSIERDDIEKDENDLGTPNLTKADALRIAYDLVGRGFLSGGQLNVLTNELKIYSVSPILCPNQYRHLMNWLLDKGYITEGEFSRFSDSFPEVPFDGI